MLLAEDSRGHILGRKINPLGPGWLHGRSSREACVLRGGWQIFVSGMRRAGASSEVLPHSERLTVSHLDMSDADLFFRLKVSNLGNAFHLLHMPLCKCQLLTLTSFSFSQGLFSSDTSREELGATCSSTSIGEIFCYCGSFQE